MQEILVCFDGKPVVYLCTTNYPFWSWEILTVLANGYSYWSWIGGILSGRHIKKKKKKPRLLTLFLLFIIVDQPQCESALRLGFGGRALHTRVNTKKLYFRYWFLPIFVLLGKLFLILYFLKYWLLSIVVSQGKFCM